MATESDKGRRKYFSEVSCWCRIERLMTEKDAILNASQLFTEEEILAEFQECCESEAETPGQHTDRLKRACEDLWWRAV